MFFSKTFFIEQYTARRTLKPSFIFMIKFLTKVTLIFWFHQLTNYSFNFPANTIQWDLFHGGPRYSATQAILAYQSASLMQTRIKIEIAMSIHHFTKRFFSINLSSSLINTMALVQMNVAIREWSIDSLITVIAGFLPNRLVRLYGKMNSK